MDAAERALAHAEISNLLSLYYQALDRGDLETLAADVIAEDATWVLVQLCADERVVDESSGRDAIVEWFRRMFGAGVSMTEGTVRHYLNTHVIDVEGDAARSTSHLQAVETAGMTNVASGFVRAEHVRTAAGWRIARYEVEETITRKDMDALKATFHADD
jgi:ketosteroid isomerase-like protein